MISSLSSMYLKPFFNGLPDMFNLQQGLPKLYFQIQLQLIGFFSWHSFRGDCNTIGLSYNVSSMSRKYPQITSTMFRQNMNAFKNRVFFLTTKNTIHCSLNNFHYYYYYLKTFVCKLVLVRSYFFLWMSAKRTCYVLLYRNIRL